ncbi:septum site-determining protein Ssd [Nocardia sp. NPDC004860]|uniref:septum site-determining protein Ssd n=1 Tax=Nocardia sp. NPDC004860 TaxID=3154557 RepID=UPI0033A1B0CF
MNSDAATPPALSLVADPRLRDEIRRIAAAADRPLDERVPPPGRHAWTNASVIIVDTAAAHSCASAAHPRRPGILLVTDGEPGLLDWQAATAAGAEQVLPLPAAADALIAAFAAHDRRRPGDGAVLAVAGAGAGSGASVLAAAVALTAAGRFRDRTLLVDCAPYGGGLDLLLGLERAPGLRWPDLTIEHGRVSAPALHEALPATAGLAVLSCGRGAPATELGALSPSADPIASGRSSVGGAASHAQPVPMLHPGPPGSDGTSSLATDLDRPSSCVIDRGVAVFGPQELSGATGDHAAELSRTDGSVAAALAPAAVRAVLEGGRAAGDLVVADLSSDHGPHTDQVLDVADLVVLVTQARLRSIAAAESAATYLTARNPNVRLIVRGPAPGGLAPSEIAEALALPLLTAVPSQPGLTERLERGGLTVRRRGPLRTAAETALTALFSESPRYGRPPGGPGPSWWRIARAHGSTCGSPLPAPAGARK